MTLSSAQTAIENTLPLQDENGVWVWETHYPSNIDWRADIPEGSLLDVFESSVTKFADKPALTFQGHRYDYAAFGDMVNRVAKGLQDMGVAKGDKVGLFVPNNPMAPVFYYGILKAGGTVVNYNPGYVERDVLHQIQDSETRFMVTLDVDVFKDKLYPLIETSCLEKLIICPADGKDLLSLETAPASDETTIYWAELIDNAGDAAAVDIDPMNDIAVLQYTGGTTGVPKGAMLTHHNIYANTYQVSLWFHNIEAGMDKQMGVLPLFHVFAMTMVMNLSIWHGMEVVLMPQFEMKEVLRIIHEEKLTHFAAVPSIYNMMGSYAGIENFDFSSLKFCLSGGAPLPGDVKRLFEEKTQAFRVAEGYGLTESSPVATCSPVTGDMEIGSIGMPIPGTVIEIINPEDGETVLPVGEKGEICISGPQVMKGYYNKPEETDNVIRNGRLHTGDIGYMDEKGFVYLVDRIKDLILVSGFNVYPRHVEEAIYLHPSVAECIVAGVPDQARGEAVWAWVKPVEGGEIEASELRSFLKDKLSPAELPRKIIMRDEPLPKTAVGKLSRKDLLEQEGITRV